MNRTQQQIVQRINEIAKEDMFGWQTNDLIFYLDYDHAKEFIRQEVDAEEWANICGGVPLDPVASIRNYMSFAWDKANNCRGISAGRSIEHMKAWLWLDEQDDLLAFIEKGYDYYGKPQLVKVCEHYGIDWRALDNNEWVNNEDETPLTADEALQ